MADMHALVRTHTHTHTHTHTSTQNLATKLMKGTE
jgi:hypothetical protein